MLQIPLDMKTAAGLEVMTRMANSLGQISKVSEERIISVQTLLNLRERGFQISGEFPWEVGDESLFLWGSLAICPSEYVFVVSHEWEKMSWGCQNIILVFHWNYLCWAALTYYLLCYHLPEAARLIGAPSGIAGAWGSGPPCEGAVCWHCGPATPHAWT